MAVVDGCCCCCSLKTGVIVISVLYVVVSLIQVGTTANSLAKGEYYSDSERAIDNINNLLNTEVNKNLRGFADSVDSSFGISGSDSFSNRLDEATYQVKVTKSQLITSLVFALIQALCGILLFFGAIKEKAGLLLPWVIVETLVFIATTIIGILLIIGLFGTKNAATAAWVATLALALYVLLTIYFLLVVYSYYQTLRENPRRYV